MSKKTEASRVYVYKEGNDWNTEGENITQIFPDRKSAGMYFRKRVSEHYQVPFEKVETVLAKQRPGENITDRSCDTYFSEDEIIDDGNWWLYYEDPVATVPNEKYEKIDIERYQIQFNGTQFENGYPYGLVSIFEFDSEAGNAKPKNGGKPVLSFYSELGGPELVRGTDEKFVKLLLDNVPANSRQNLVYWYKTWMYM